MKISAEDNLVYEYYIDESPNELGYSLATMPITGKIKSKLFPVSNADVQCLKEIDSSGYYELKYGEDDEYSFEIWPVSIENLVGKYYDKEGFVYYNIENQLYKFRFNLNYFKELYKSKINGA